MLPERQILEILGTCDGEVGLYLEDLAAGQTFTVNPDRYFPRPV